MAADRTGLIGVGYQGASLDDFVTGLVTAGVGMLADVRLNPISRRFGFSKTRLSAAVRDAGIDYTHFRALGNPTTNRAGFADVEGLAGRLARRRYRALLGADEAHAALQELAVLSDDQLVAVLCFEMDQAVCHRALVIEGVGRVQVGSIQKSGNVAASRAFG